MSLQVADNRLKRVKGKVWSAQTSADLQDGPNPMRKRCYLQKPNGKFDQEFQLREGSYAPTCGKWINKATTTIKAFIQLPERINVEITLTSQNIPWRRDF